MRRHGRVVPLILLALLAFGFPSSTSVAQPRAGVTPVIAVFKADTPFEMFRAHHRADERASANPAAWGYLNRDVVGLVHMMEARDGFRAQHVFSHAIRASKNGSAIKRLYVGGL